VAMTSVHFLEIPRPLLNLSVPANLERRHARQRSGNLLAEFRVGAQDVSRAYEAAKEVANDLRTHGRIDVHSGAAPIGRLVGVLG